MLITKLGKNANCGIKLTTEDKRTVAKIVFMWDVKIFQFKFYLEVKVIKWEAYNWNY